MDIYLKEDENFKRLLAEYRRYKSLTIGVDFDDTLRDFHRVGGTHEMVRQLVRELKALGCIIIIWTANNDLEFVAKYCKKHNIPQDGINTDGVPLGWYSRKPFFNCLLDDRAGLLSAYNDLNKLVNTIKAGDNQ